MNTSNLSYKPLTNPKQELFCQKYAEIGGECFWSWVRAYAFAYWLDVVSNSRQYNIAKSWWSENLTKPYIFNRVQELLELGWLTDLVVDAHHAYLIRQNANLRVKISAIKEYNRMRQRTIKKKVDISENTDISRMTQQEKINYLQNKLRVN